MPLSYFSLSCLTFRNRFAVWNEFRLPSFLPLLPCICKAKRPFGLAISHFKKWLQHIAKTNPIPIATENAKFKRLKTKQAPAHSFKSAFLTFRNFLWKNLLFCFIDCSTASLLHFLPRSACTRIFTPSVSPAYLGLIFQRTCYYLYSLFGLYSVSVHHSNFQNSFII